MNADALRATPDNGGEWDSKWASLGRNMLQLYTRGAPKTMHQFWQRCYFEDLWACMGSNASSGAYLEIGAGRGTTSMYLSRAGCDVTMLDLSESGFQVAAANFAREGLKIPRMVHADARETGLPSEGFDCVFSIGLLEHFEDPAPVLRESARLLRPGGLQFAVIIPDRSASVRHLARAIFCPWSLAYGMLPEQARRRVRKWRGHAEPSPDNAVLRTSYSRADYLRMMQGLDVEDLRCVPYNPYHPVYSRASLEASIAIPMYRAHRKFKALFGRPTMLTSASVASCDLLMFRKSKRKTQ